MDDWDEFVREFFEMERLVDEMPKNNLQCKGKIGNISQYDIPIPIQELPNDLNNITDVINKKYGLEPCQK